VNEEKLWAALREVQDPEMPINIVDLGLIYGLQEERGTVKVTMTLTAMGCPGSEFIIEDIKERLQAEDEVKAVEVEIVWSPPWSAARVSEEGRDALEMWDLAL
jgi:metal-sulfur cluster biosynthetic enzyme